ncbi:MAG: (d)CMP kinase [bacterium]
MSKKIIVAIDGPAGSGKSTAAKNLANEFGFLYLDTGAMYRAVTYLVLKEGIYEQNDKIIELIKTIDLKLKYENGKTRVFLNSDEITEEIRTPEVTSLVSEVSIIPEVREELVRLQRQIGEQGSIVTEGRDITTVVFPNADLKIYLTASVDERAKRRFKEYKDKGIEIDFTEVKNNIEKRDKIDSGREISPLMKADDAIEIDTSDITVEEELQRLSELVNKILK